MRKVLIGIVCVFIFSSVSHATNGDNLISIGPISRAMGGVGVASPLDAISAVFSNPAAMCFGPYCPASEFDFAGTLFKPDVSAKLTRTDGTYSADSDDSVYAIPAIGISTPIGSVGSPWRFGLAAYGVSGLGVDYRGTDLDQPNFAGFGGFPLISGEYTQLQIMKFSPAIAYQLSDVFSLGFGVQIDYANLDLRNGSSPGYGIGVQLGAIYKPSNELSFGLTYVSPQNVDHDNVADFDGDGNLDTLKVEAPQQVGFGAAYDFFSSKLLVEADLKWLNWSEANAYKEFDWDDQWVFAIGGELEPTKNLFLRLGYNYGKNPVNTHNGFNGTGTTSVQGKTMNTYYYETFRIIGFPAIVEHHITGGIGYQFTDRFMIHAGAVFALENDIKQSGTDVTGQPVTMESSLSEYSIDFGFTWRF